MPAKIWPAKKLDAPIVADVPTAQKTFAARAPFFRIIEECAPVTKVVSDWKMKKPAELPWASSTTLPHACKVSFLLALQYTEGLRVNPFISVGKAEAQAAFLATLRAITISARHDFAAGVFSSELPAISLKRPDMLAELPADPIRPVDTYVGTALKVRAPPAMTTKF